VSEQADASWERLGDLLEHRRVQLNPRYANLTLFAEERGIDYRMAWDAEHARRTNYRRPTLTAIEVAYGWKPGSIRSVLDGGDPAPAPGSPGSPEIDSRPAMVRDNWDDETVRIIWQLATPPEATKLGMIADYLRRQDAGNGNGHSRSA
jgi:hypothetical protein